MFSRTKILTPLFALILTMVIASCTSMSSLRIGWACFDSFQKVDCSYREFSGREINQGRFDAGDRVIVNYDITVDSGNLTFRIEDPDNQVVLAMNVTESTQETIAFTAEQTGRYSFVVEGEETAGAFLIEWEYAQ